MNSNKETALISVELFYRKGGRLAVISPGSRNAPLTIAFQNHPKIRCFSIVDERSAGFYALGMCKANERMTGLICTSGTALLNYYPALIEAKMQNLPLVVFSADRPEAYIGQGIGQSIQQQNVFGESVNAFAHLNDNLNSNEDIWYTNRKINEVLNSALGPNQGPVHINLAFHESLYVQNEFNLKDDAFRNIEIQAVSHSLSENALNELTRSWKLAKKKMIICGMLSKSLELTQLFETLEKNNDVVILHESTSNLPSSLGVSTIDRVLQKAENDDQCKPDLLISFGKHIISKRIKSFLNASQIERHWYVDAGDAAMDTYQALTDIISVPPDVVLKALSINDSSNKSFQSKWFGYREHVNNRHDDFLENTTFSDLMSFSIVLRNIPKAFHLELANSSVIRYAQLFSHRNWSGSSANRGTSGIEGSTSTAVGFCMASSKPTLLITGDISFFYDSNALWCNQIPSNFRIIILNNGGGGIFRFIEGPSSVPNFETFFESAHDLNAEGMANTFGLKYSSCDSEQSLKKELATFFILEGDKARILEIHTPRFENDKILKSYFRSLSD